MNFEMAEQQKSFVSILKEFVYVFFFTVLLCGLVFLLFDLDERKTERFRCYAEVVRQHLGLKSFYYGGNYFTGGKMQSDRFAFEGTHSLELTKEDAFGFQFEIPYLKGNENITASVWRYSNGKDSRKGIMVASAKGMWKAGEEVIEKSDSGWEKIQLSFVPPPKCKNRTLKIYCWNSGYEPIYFDNLEIEIRREEPL